MGFRTVIASRVFCVCEPSYGSRRVLLLQLKSAPQRPRLGSILDHLPNQSLVAMHVQQCMDCGATFHI
jgi:hypothetical protein